MYDGLHAGWENSRTRDIVRCLWSGVRNSRAMAVILYLLDPNYERDDDADGS
mgnify:CR=1 FL=1